MHLALNGAKCDAESQIIHCTTPGIPKGKKSAVSVSIASGADILIRQQNMTSQGRKTKNLSS